MSSYYDAFGGTSTDGPDDPYADELELERRDKEIEPDEPAYDLTDEQWALLQVQEGTPTDEDYLDCSELDDHTCSTSAPRKLHQMDYNDVESKARREDGPEHDFWSGLNDEADSINIITGEVEE